ncbi:MAG: TSUP family transporter [Tissierellia bacterium]|nr:TSUP family transporter [Tissierellia bacterium]
MELTVQTLLIVCPLVFFAGLIDAIGGGGGLISLPAYLIAGLPPHMAIATNKMSSTFGTFLATARFIKNKLINFKLTVPSIIASIIGASIGSNLSLIIDEKYLLLGMIIVLPLSAFIVLNKKLFNDDGTDEIKLNKHTIFTATISALIIGCYDGFYGPGTGTFLIIAFVIFTKISIKIANAQAKVINLTTNITSLAIFLYNGKVIITLGLIAAICNMIGNYIGSGLVMKNGSKIVKPSIIFVLFLLSLKVLEYIKTLL